MKPIIAETFRVVFSRPGPLVLIALVIAVSCATVILTTGRTVATETKVLDKLDSLGTRVVTVTDNNQTARIDPQTLTMISSMSGVDWVLGLGPASDVRNAITHTVSQPVAARAARGSYAGALTLLEGRWPEPGEAIASASAARALGFVDGSGRVEDASGKSFGVVGVYSPKTSLAGFENLILFEPANAERYTSQLFIYVSTSSVSNVDQIAEAIPKLLLAQNPSAVSVEIADTLKNVRAGIAGELSGSSRFLMLVALAVSLIVVMLTLFAASAERKRDFGRRRALGATRSALTGMVLTQAIVSAAVGAVGGITLSLVYASAVLSSEVPLQFAVGVGTLSVISAATASLPPALRVAYSDPAVVLRVP